MNETTLEELKYPIGYFKCPNPITESHVSQWIKELEVFPKKLEDLVVGLNALQLEVTYRPGGWTLRQLVHHIADSHHHSYTRFKWALTEDKPLIKAYEEKNWAKLFDAHTAPIQLSLDYIKVLHAKLVYLLKGLSEEKLERIYMHPEGNIAISIAENIGKYAWHGNHHYAHINNLIVKQGWK